MHNSSGIQRCYDFLLNPKKPWRSDNVILVLHQINASRPCHVSETIILVNRKHKFFLSLYIYWSYDETSCLQDWGDGRLKSAK